MKAKHAKASVRLNHAITIQKTIHMMKKSILFALPLATMLAASCSSDDNIDAGKNNGNGGDAYVAVSINLPTTNGTRAGYTETFDDGTEAEYNVKDVTVLIFNADDDKFEQYYSTENGSLSALTWEKQGTTDNVTTSATTVPLRVADNGEKHVVVILNNDKKHDFSTLANLDGLKAMLNATDKTSADYGKYTTTANDGCFFMSTSPYMTNGDGSKLVTYTSIIPSVTAEKAKETGNLGVVYVERILGKVSLTKPSNAGWSEWAYTIPTDVNSTSSPYSGGTVTIQNWLLDVTNNSSYLLRNVAATDVEGSGTWTSVSNLIGGNQSGMKRIYWTKDTNYDKSQATDDNAESAVKTGLFTTLGADAGSSVNGELGTPQYCFENTFDTDNMRQDRTTRVLFKAKFTPNGFKDGDTWYTVGASSTPLNAVQFEARIEAAVKAAGVTASLKTDWANQLKSTDKALTAAVFSTEVSDDDLSKIQTDLGKIQVYAGGECYYVGRVRHFVDLTGTDAWPAGGRTPNFYATKDLGRYGIVRNNWYQLTVNTISQPGSPDVPQPTPDWDDVNNYYIDCTINILSWAVRTHGFDF